MGRRGVLARYELFRRVTEEDPSVVSEDDASGGGAGEARGLTARTGGALPPHPHKRPADPAGSRTRGPSEAQGQRAPCLWGLSAVGRGQATVGGSGV